MVSKVIALHTIHLTIKPGVAANRVTGEAAIAPVVKEVPGGTAFTPRTQTEFNELMKLGAIRLPGEDESIDSFRTLELDDDDREVKSRPGKTDEEIRAAQAQADADQKKRDAAAAKVKADAEAKLKAQSTPKVKPAKEKAADPLKAAKEGDVGGTDEGKTGEQQSSGEQSGDNDDVV
jgi:hypothetical protein